MITSGFYDSIDHDRKYNSLQFGSIFDGIIQDGVFMHYGDRLKVSASEGMNVLVGTGRAWFNHTWTLNDAPLPLTIEQSEVILDRVDTVALDVDARTEGRNNDIIVVKGTPSDNPSPPTLIDTSDRHQYPLAYIVVKAGVTEITGANITLVVGQSTTPYVTGVLEVMSIDELTAQWQAQWHEQLARQEQEYQAWINSEQAVLDGLVDQWHEQLARQDQEFRTWFDSLQVILDGDVATKLASEVLTLTSDTSKLKESALLDDSFTE